MDASELKNRFEDIRRYNLWDGNDIHPGVWRSKYTDDIFRYLDSGLVKVLTGQRRVGKSYILRQIAMKLVATGVDKRNIFIINKEYSAFDFISDSVALDRFIRFYKEQLGVEGKYYLLIDEVQDITDWEKTINSYSQDYTENADIFITGSNSNLLSGELSTKLSGRYVKFQIYTLSYDEYLEFNDGEKSRTSYLEYMRTGGLPALRNLLDYEMKANYVSALRDTIMLKDIVGRYGVKDVRLLEVLFAYLSSTASSLVSLPNIVNYIKSNGNTVSYTTVASYINYLVESYLIHRVERYNLKGKEIITGPAKYYPNDLAYKNYLYPDYGGGVGYMLENIVYLDLLRAGFTPRVGALQKLEIDFVAEKGGRQIYVQVSYSLEDEHTREREIAPLMQLLPAYEKWIVTLDDFAPVLPGGIRVIRAWDLCKVLDEFDSFNP